MQSKFGRVVWSVLLNIMRHKLDGIVLTGIGLMMTAWVGLPANAAVTVQGKVEYWDRLAGQYKPAKDVFVEVEGDWWWRSDPEVQTDNHGFYRASVDDPPWWWDDYDDVDIEVYAEKPDRIQIFEHIFAPYPYHAISKEVNNVKDGQTVTINLKIGGPQNNIGEAYYRTPDETANAFLVHQEMLAHYRRLRQMGFPESDLEKTYATNWSGANRSVTENITVPTGTGNPDVLWLIVSDEMQPTAHRLTIPVSGTVALPSSGLFVSDLSDASQHPASRLVPTAAGGAPKEMPTITEQAQVRTLTAEDAQKVKVFRDLIQQASRELRDYAERNEMMLRRERGLYKMAQIVGDLKVPANTPTPFLRKPLAPGRQPPTLSAAQTSTRQTFQQWMDRTATGKALERPLTAQDKSLLRTHQQLLNQQLQRQQNFATRIQQLTQQLRSALNAIPFGAESVEAQEDAKRALKNFEAVMGIPIEEKELLSRLQKQNAVLTAIVK